MEAHPLTPSIPARVPRVIVGTERMGSVLPDGLASRSSREETFRFLDEVLDAGCTAFDTAASYQLGGTERLLGQWMRARRNRERLFIIGKGAHPYPVVRPNRLTARDLESDLDDSLRRLDTDRIDLYLVHRDSPGVALAPILEALLDFVRRGKIVAFGVSNFHHDRVAELERLAREANAQGVTASSPQFSLARWTRPQWSGTVSISGDAAARAWYAERAIAVLAWSPLGRGFFARSGGSVYEDADNAARRDRVEKLSARRGCEATQIALAWLFAQPPVVYAVVSSRSSRRMKSNLEATELRLTSDEVRWLESGGSEPS